MSLSFKEYSVLLETIRQAEQLDEGAVDWAQKQVEALKAAIKMRAERKAAELAAKLSAEAAKRRKLRGMKQPTSSAAQAPLDDGDALEQALSPEDRKFLAKAQQRYPAGQGSNGTQGTVGTQGTR